MIEDVEAVTQSQMKPETKSDAGFDWEDYQSHDDINAFIEGLAASNSEWISIKNIGKYKLISVRLWNFQDGGLILKGNHCILRIRGAPIRQKLGMILENKMVQKLKLEKKMSFTKNGLLN